MSVSPMNKTVLGARSAGQRVWRSSFVRDVLSLSGGTGIAQVIALAILPLLSRLYSPADFGLLTLYISIVTILTVFSSFSYELMIMQARSHRAASQLVWLVLAIGICAAGTVLVGVALFRHQIANLMGAPEIAAWLWTVPMLMVQTAAYKAFRYWKLRMRKFALISHSLITRALVFAAVAAVVPFIPLGTTLNGAGLITAFIFSEIAKTLVLVGAAHYDDKKHFAPFNLARMEAVGRRHGAVAATMSVSWVTSFGYLRFPDFIISSFFGTATLGLYSMVGRAVAAPSRLVANAIGDVYRQRASELHRKHGRFHALTLKALGTTAAISFVPFVVAIIYAPTLFSTLLGPEWKLAGHYASILLVGEFLSFIISPIQSASLIVQDRRFIFFWSFARLLLILGLYPFLRLGLLDFIGFLWAMVGIRILMNILAGAASYSCAKSGRPLRWRAHETLS